MCLKNKFPFNRQFMLSIEQQKKKQYKYNSSYYSNSYYPNNYESTDIFKHDAIYSK